MIKKGIDYRVLKKSISPNIEIIAVEIKKEVFINVYLPPSTHPKAAFEELQQLVTNKKITILGEFNINLGEDSFTAPETAPTEQLHDFSRFNNLIPTVWKPTRITKNSATVIDNILTSKTEPLTTGILTSQVADHLAPFIIFHGDPKNHKTSKPQFIETRCFNEENTASLRKELQQTSWDEVLIELDPNH